MPPQTAEPSSPSRVVPHINRIATATPSHDVHEGFVAFARTMLQERRGQVLFDRMAARCGIGHRWSVLQMGSPGSDAIDREGRFRRGGFPSTGWRMKVYEEHAPKLAVEAVEQLGPLDGVTHLVVASCTGFVAPGIDQLLIDRLGLSPNVDRTMVGFMGCSAAVPSLKTAFHAIRSDPAARVLVVAVELCTLHLQETPDLETVLSFMLFGDGCAAALVTAEPEGLALNGFRAQILPNTQDMITWRIGDQGFDMHLSGHVPARIAAAVREDLARNDDGGMLAGRRPDEYGLWAVHAGGRTVLDAVEQGYGLPAEALRHSRAVLHDFGNVSSATILFVLRRMMAEETPGQEGLAMAFGPGMAAETFRFTLR